MEIEQLHRKIYRKILRTLSPYTRAAGAYCSNKFPSGTFVFSDDTAHVFCGYYDVMPFDETDSRLLALRCFQDHTSPHDTTQSAEIGFYNTENPDGVFYKIAETRSWNWQQGCRLQWLPNHRDRVIYKDFRPDMFVSVVYDLATAEEFEINRPFYALHPDGKSFFSLDFSRLHRFRRGYGYHQLYEAGQIEASPQNDGVWRGDIDSGEAQLLISLYDIAAFLPRDSMDGAYHYINHLQWSPDGSRIIFFHLWANDKKSKNSRLLSLDEKGNLTLVDGNIRPSHTAWLDNDKLLVTGLKKDSEQMYHLYDFGQASGSFYESSIVGLTLDGHPTFLNSSEFISDTYPDMWGRQELFVGNLQGNRQFVASFYLPERFSGELRCDLHPRLSISKRLVACDIVTNNKRSVAVIPIKERK